MSRRWPGSSEPLNTDGDRVGERVVGFTVGARGRTGGRCTAITSESAQHDIISRRIESPVARNPSDRLRPRDHQHSAGAGSPVLPVSLDARRRHHRARAGRRLVAVKNVTVNEEFFQGHFPGTPLMPGVLMLESLSQAAALLLLQREDGPPNARVYLRGVNDAKFRRQVVPGDRLRLEVTLGRQRRVARAGAGDGVSWATRSSPSASCCSASMPDRDRDRPVGDRPPRGPDRRGHDRSGRTPSIGPHVRIGAGCRDRRVGGHRRLDRDRRRHGDLSRSPRSASCRRTSSSRARRRGWSSASATSSASS